MSDYLIGIDLGTSHCSLAYRKRMDQKSQQLEIYERNEDGVKAPNYFLPSALFFPRPEEKSTDEAFYLGYYARKKGLGQPARLLSSAKSWLCHESLDRRAAFLPLHCEEKISPLDACANYLRVLKASWEQTFPKAPFLQQSVFITVPASFDPSARQLVEEAVQKAGFQEAVFLEEPQAAFYAWLDKKGDAWREELFVDEKILVIDIGGGTSDFSLIGVKDCAGDLELERVAVGDHLLLGGDNMDLALAHFLQQKLQKQGFEIDQRQFQELLGKARLAKEQLLDGQESQKISISGQGSSFMAGSVETNLCREEIEKMILDGFFPMISHTEYPRQQLRSGFQKMGLPFESDARITAHLAAFLSKAGGEQGFVFPDAILFNGGVLKAKALQERLMQLFSTWADAVGKQAPRFLDASDLDFAVSQGAVYYGLAREGNAVRIKSGVSHNYYIGIEEPAPAVPGMEVPLKALCVVPFGMEEGSEIEISFDALYLLLGQKSSFRFFSKKPALEEGPEKASALVSIQGLEEHHPIETEMLSDQEGLVKVSIKSCLNDLGVLELFCIAEDQRQWKLQFNLRSEQPQGVCSV